MRVSITWSVPGRVWLSGKAAQDREWESARKRFDDDVAAKGLTLVGDPTESTEYDEQHRHVLLHIEARAQPAVNCWIAPVGTKWGDPGWKPVGWIDPGQFFSIS
jgi:hypothetical protein